MLICDHIVMFPVYTKKAYRMYPTYYTPQGLSGDTMYSYIVPGDPHKCSGNYWDTRVEGNLTQIRAALKN